VLPHRLQLVVCPRHVALDEHTSSGN
jgi:hypothetical protein